MVKYHRVVAISGILPIVLGSLMLFNFYSVSSQQQSTLSGSAAAQIPSTMVQKTEKSTAAIKGTPRFVSIQSLGIATNIVDGSYTSETGQWTISEDAAYYATVSDLANNESGNTFIYGHNSDHIFGKLLNITPGATAEVQTDNGYRLTYRFESTEAVSPTDVQSLAYTGSPARLTLQTCSGAWNQNRQMIYFSFVSAEKL